MTQSKFDNSVWPSVEQIRRGWESQPQEFNYECTVEGNIPNEISGSFFRNGPGLLEVYGTPLVHPIDGDGMVCSVSIKDGRAHFRSKYVATKEYTAEKAEQKALYRGMMGTNPVDDWKESLERQLKDEKVPDQPKFKNPSNTNVYFWGGKLLACWESGLPYSLDPVTLETIGRDNLGGALDESNCLAAHFRYDSVHDRLVTFSLRLSLRKSTRLFIHEFDRQWNLVKQQIVEIEQYNYAHDFLLTDNYYVFHHTPFYNFTADNLMKIATMQHGPGQTMQYYPEVPSGMVVIPRYPAPGREGQFKFFKCEPFHIYHHINAYETETGITFSSVCLGEAFTMEFEGKFSLFNASAAPGRVYSFDINLALDTMTWKQVDGCSCEFPTSNISMTGKPWRYAYLMAAEAGKPEIPYQEVIKFDTAQSNRQVWSARSESGVIGEPVFIPHPEGKEEDDGWVIVQMYCCKTHKTQFVLLDARDLSAGPIARIHLNYHIPYGFHGTWSTLQ
eukprot:CAMPEP_0206194036 /NCGR_PEP_ID=MMETSP0166-20121206/6946_1 /ASSEMBLY_ACC=CAM_ASM_000260 /TAXON_ID=95228 /ORGANISM="Vannella robusta, Strain DIVA3 518/3/11/1/6" /LENGTH=501 /DNA_ID=CAMNT_0053610909 /DNA_START=69 /DNA_END=1574 /DNA_ORIENTATION=+